MFTVFLVIQVIVTIALVAAILIQRSDSDGLGSLGGGGGGANALMTGRGQANLLTRATAVLATIFMVNSLLLAIIVSRSNEVSLIDRVEQEESLSVPMADEVVKPAPLAPAEEAPAVENVDEVPAAQEIPAAPVENEVEETVPAVPQQ